MNTSSSAQTRPFFLTFLRPGVYFLGKWESSPSFWLPRCLLPGVKEELLRWEQVHACDQGVFSWIHVQKHLAVLFYSRGQQKCFVGKNNNNKKPQMHSTDFPMTWLGLHTGPIKLSHLKQIQFYSLALLGEKKKRKSKFRSLTRVTADIGTNLLGRRSCWDIKAHSNGTITSSLFEERLALSWFQGKC